MINGKAKEGYVFSHSGLKSIAFPSTLKEIPQNSFWLCSNLRRAQFSEGLKTIGLSAFQETGLESVVLPGSLRTITQGAFCKCNSLRTVKFCEGLEVLGVDEYEPEGNGHCGVFYESAVEEV